MVSVRGRRWSSLYKLLLIKWKHSNNISWLQYFFFLYLSLSLTFLLIHSIFSEISCLSKKLITAVDPRSLSLKHMVECWFPSQKLHQQCFSDSAELQCLPDEQWMGCSDGPRPRTPVPFFTCNLKGYSPGGGNFCCS